MAFQARQPPPSPTSGFDPEVRLPPEPVAAQLGRRFARNETTRQELPGNVVENIELLVSELVTNCVKHGRLTAQDHVDLRIGFLPDRVRVEVTDPGKGLAPRERLRPGPSSGWGLFLVGRLSDRWGSGEGRGTVWFEI